jgi:predicted DNA-binding ribbon-helix-helix protein
MAERAASQTEIDSIRTVYLTHEDHESLKAIARAQDSSSSALIRSFLDDYLNDKLKITKVKPRKTTVWVDPTFWEEVRTKATDENVSIAQIIQAGMARLRGVK